MSQIVNTRDLILRSTAKRTVYSTANKVLLLDADAPVFIEQEDQTYLPLEIHLTATPLNIAGNVVFACSPGGKVTQVGNVGTVKASDMQVDRVTITATIVEEGVTYSKSKVISTVIDGIASIKLEQTIRQEQNFALASQILTISAAVGDNAALIRNEATTRANSYSALATQISTVSAATASASARITSEQTARVNADNALATNIQSLNAVTGANTAAISTEQTARTNADSALSNRVDSVSAETGQNTAAITSEQVARTNADNALSGRIDTVTASTGANTAAITAEQLARTNADSALSTRIDSVVASSGGSNAAIQQEITARTNADTALASQINTLSTTVGNNTATVTQFATSIDGLRANYGVKIDAQGRTIGYALNSGEGGVGSFVIAADRFSIVNPGTFDYRLYWDGARLVVDGDIYARNFYGNVVATNNINAGAVSGQVAVYDATQIFVDQYQIKDMGVVVVQCSGAPVTLIFGCIFTVYNNGGALIDSCRLLLTRDGNPVPLSDFAATLREWTPFSLAYTDNPGPGTFIYRWRLKGPDVDATTHAAAINRSLIALELKR